MERIVIVGYKPLAGKQNELKKLSLAHWERLNDLGLVSARKPIIMQATGGTVVEVFGWKSKTAMEQAHSNPKVLAMWQQYAAVCEFVPVGSISEAADLFSEFSPVN